jgi:hypothetical protein
MEQHLKNRKKMLIIDFIRVPILWGRSFKEFVGFDLEHKYFFRIFFDNKYRQDNFKPEKRIEELRLRMEEYSDGGFGSGIFSTKELFDECKKELDFYNKYLNI